MNTFLAGLLLCLAASLPPGSLDKDLNAVPTETEDDDRLNEALLLIDLLKSEYFKLLQERNSETKTKLVEQSTCASTIGVGSSKEKSILARRQNTNTSPSSDKPKFLGVWTMSHTAAPPYPPGWPVKELGPARRFYGQPEPRLPQYGNQFPYPRRLYRRNFPDYSYYYGLFSRCYLAGRNMQHIPMSRSRRKEDVLQPVYSIISGPSRRKYYYDDDEQRVEANAEYPENEATTVVSSQKSKKRVNELPPDWGNRRRSNTGARRSDSSDKSTIASTSSAVSEISSTTESISSTTGSITSTTESLSSTTGSVKSTSESKLSTTQKNKTAPKKDNISSTVVASINSNKSKLSFSSKATTTEEKWPAFQFKPTLKVFLENSTPLPIPLPDNNAFCFTNPRNAMCRALR